MTINQLIKYIEEQSSGNSPETIERLNAIKTELVAIKNAPELSNSCSLDKKLSNADVYINRINNIISKSNE